MHSTGHIMCHMCVLVMSIFVLHDDKSDNRFLKKAIALIKCSH